MSPDYKISTLDFRKHKWDTYQKMSVAKKKKPRNMKLIF